MAFVATKLASRLANGLLVLTRAEILRIIASDVDVELKRFPAQRAQEARGVAWLLAAIMAGRLLKAEEADKAGLRFAKQAKLTGAALLCCAQEHRGRRRAAEPARGAEKRAGSGRAGSGDS